MSWWRFGGDLSGDGVGKLECIIIDTLAAHTLHNVFPRLLYCCTLLEYNTYSQLNKGEVKAFRQAGILVEG